MAAAVLVAGCGSDGEASGPSSSTSIPRSTTSSSSTTTAATTTTTSIPDRPTLAASCSSPDGFSIRYPDGWEAVADCSQFGPAPVALPAPGTDERTGSVVAHVDSAPFHVASRPGQGERNRAATVVDGLQAVRVDQVASGAGLHPAGTRHVSWLVDLAIGVDDGPGTLVVDVVDVDGAPDFSDRVVALDAMARSLDIEAGDAPESDHVVARQEGGGAPLTVVAAPSASQPSSCLRLLEDDAIACVEAVDADDGVALTELEGPAGPVIVGIAGADAFALDLDLGDRTASVLPVPYAGRPSRGFALPGGVDTLESVTVRAIDGSTLASHPVGDVRRPATG
ncbi:MAG: hypothetical protein KF703_03980 [Actinobacteria bacterium]|nr:hypothetical protein [Actinomycetota bacterium]